MTMGRFLHRFFLRPYLACIVMRLYDRYTLVGLEVLPDSVLTRNFDLSDADLALRPVDPDLWACRLKTIVMDALRGLPYLMHRGRPRHMDVYHAKSSYDHTHRSQGRDNKHQLDCQADIEQLVTILTRDEYRAQVGDETFMFETFEDELMDGGEPTF
jgi:hypothetical protein